MNTENILIALVAITGVSVLLQIIVLLALTLAVRKGVETMKGYVEELRESALPLMAQARDFILRTKDLLNRMEPRLEAASVDLAEMTRTAREETEKLQVSLDQINERVQRQADRIDGMATTALNGVDRASRFVNDAVSIPFRQVSGFVAAARAVIGALRQPARSQRDTERVPGEKDLFV